MIPLLCAATDIVNFELAAWDFSSVPRPEAQDPTETWLWNSASAGLRFPLKAQIGLDEVRLRHHPSFGSVVLTCSSSGWAAVLSYPDGKPLAEAEVPLSPHSAELLPDGTFLVACAGGPDGVGGGLFAFSGEEPLRTLCFFPCRGAHGVCWSPRAGRIYVNGYDGINALVPVWDGASLTLTSDPEQSIVFFATVYTHDLQPDYATPGEYWVSAPDRLYRFCPARRSFFPAQGPFALADIKGIASFSDGSVVLSVPGGPGRRYPSGSTCRFLCYRPDAQASGGYEKETVFFTHREFYKLHAFTLNYE